MSSVKRQALYSNLFLYLAWSFQCDRALFDNKIR